MVTSLLHLTPERSRKQKGNWDKCCQMWDIEQALFKPRR